MAAGQWLITHFNGLLIYSRVVVQWLNDPEWWWQIQLGYSGATPYLTAHYIYIARGWCMNIDLCPINDDLWLSMMIFDAWLPTTTNSSSPLMMVDGEYWLTSGVYLFDNQLFFFFLRGTHHFQEDPTSACTSAWGGQLLILVVTKVHQCAMEWCPPRWQLRKCQECRCTSSSLFYCCLLRLYVCFNFCRVSKLNNWPVDRPLKSMVV